MLIGFNIVSVERYLDTTFRSLKSFVSVLELFLFDLKVMSSVLVLILLFLSDNKEIFETFLICLEIKNCYWNRQVRQRWLQI